MFFQIYGETAGWQLLGWLLVFAGLVVMNEIARRSKAGGIACFLILPAALSVYFIAVYVGAAMGADWALNNDTYVHMNSWFHYAKLYAASLGKSQEKRKEHYWRNTPGKRTQDIQYRYMWYERNGAKKFMALCRNGKVSSTVEFVHSSGSGNKSAYKKKYDSKDMYDVQDYDDPEDFYYDHIDEFDDVQDAEDYWEEAQQ